MKEKKGNKAMLLIVVLAIVTVIAAIVHLSTREDVAKGTIQLVMAEETSTIAISELELEQVTGTRVDGKGDEHEVSAPGISLKNLLSLEGVGEYAEIQVIADDSYAAVLKKSELDEKDNAYLILKEESLRLIVFGDSNSKRSVSNVAQIVVIE